MKNTKLLPLIAAVAAVSDYASFVGVIPFSWCRSSNELVLKKTRKIFTTLKLAFPVSSVLYMLYQSQMFILADNLPVFKRVYVVYTAIGMSILL